MLIGNYFKDLNSKYKKHSFSGLSFNSSSCKKNNIFFAIRGNKINGENFINNAIENGARTIVSKRKFQGFKKKILYINVKNVRKTLSKISYLIYKRKPENLIAVTGTNGKSSIADFYYQILKLNNIKVASIGTLGIKNDTKKITISNTTLDPILLGKHLANLKKQNINNVILEASSHGLKQNRLDGLDFRIGIFTNLSHDHLDYHRTYQDYLNSKLYLFEELVKKKSTVITDKNIPEYLKIKKICKLKKNKLITIGNSNSNLKLINQNYIGDNQAVKISYQNKIYNLKINLIGKIQIKNILMAMIAAEKSNIKFSKIDKLIEKLNPVNGRLENVGNIKNNSKVILDYAHTPEALENCLENLKDQFKDRNISIVFGCGGERDVSKRPQMGQIANKYCEKIYLTDDNPRKENPNKIRLQIKSKINKSKLIEIPKRENAIEEAIKYLNSGEILLIAGRGHERIQDYGNSKRLFSDKKYILKFIYKKNKFLSNNLKVNILKEKTSQTDISNNIRIRKASINSKELKKNDIFFALKGKKKDGNNYVKEAFKKGASIAIVNRIQKSKKKLNQIKVPNTLNFLTKVASEVRENSSAKIIAITGSCGKTSLKELIAKTLNKISNVTYSSKSYNNKFGVPLSLFNLNKKDDFGIFEVGMDKKGEIDQLTKIIKPNVGIITNISYAHIKNFKNLKQIAMAKSEIIHNIVDGGSIVLNADDKFFNFHKKIALRKGLKIYSFSFNKKNVTTKLNYIKKNKLKYDISVTINNKKKVFKVSFNSENYIKNLLAAISLISIFKNINQLNKNIFNNFIIPRGRGDISKIKIYNKNIYLIDESYNSNPLSLKSAIKNFDLINTKKNKKYLILGDMLELGKFSKSFHSQFSSIINRSSIDNLSVCGKYVKETYRNIYKNKKGLVLKENSQIFDLIKNNINNNDYLMIKGSNATGLNKITRALKKERINAL